MMVRVCSLLLLLTACGSPARPASTPEAPPGDGPVFASLEPLSQISLHGPVLALTARPSGGFRAGVGHDVVHLTADGQVGARHTHPGLIEALSAESIHEMTLAGGQLEPGFGEALTAPDGIVAIAASYDRAFGLSASALVDLRSGEVLLEELPANSTSLVANGGTLLIGHAAGVSALSLASRELSPMATTAGPVKGLALDHTGYVVAAIEEGGWVRIAPDGQATPLLPSGPAGLLAFDAVSRRLAVQRGEEIAVYDYLPLVGETASQWQTRDARPMRPFARGPYALSGAEYWPFRGDQEPDYPADVLWGFYPEAGVVFEGEAPTVSATPAAVACAEQSFAALQAFLANPPSELASALDDTTSPRFYLWVNDYSEAVDPFPEPRRPARLWYWRRDPAVAGRVPGYWKWETTLAQDGTCEVPDPSQTDWSEI
ncbi:MAG: hypothetical protein AB8I08_01695 [Sandaracinaceae bacterium]